MRMLFLASILFFLAVANSACGHHQPVKGYVPQRVHVNVARAELVGTLAVFVAENGWEVIEEDPVNGRIVALTPTTSMGDTQLRERWTFHAYDGWVEVEMSFEAAFEPGEWSSSPWVCDTYSYSREHARLSEIANRAAEIHISAVTGAGLAQK